jgi:protein-S-isoprenylcysteine O-methyltransferase Ste14
MRPTRAAVGSAVFFVVAPCLVAGLVPWLVTHWRLGDHSLAWLPLRALGVVLLLPALGLLLYCFRRFVVEGRGTPAPVAPTEQLVIGGVYRYLRNPMYVAVVAIIGGQALLFLSASLLGYGVLAWAVMAAFVHWYEEPALARRFGTGYDAYRNAVPGWLPRRPQG